MKNGRFLTAVGACVLIMAIGFWVWRSGEEPVYQGKSLSEWARIYNAETSLMSRPRRPEDVSPASQAIQTIGVKALPHLVRWIKHQPGAITLWYRRVEKKLPTAFSNSRVGRAMAGGGTYDRGFVAAYAFAALGTNARPAIPELARLLNQAGKSRVSTKAVIALARCGPQALAPMLAALTGTNDFVRGRILWQLPELQQRGVDISPALARILECLQSQNNTVVLQASGALWQMLPERGLVLPTLVSAMTNQNYYVRMTCVELFSAYGESASNALPCLIEALRDVHPVVRSQATNTIEMIDPALAQKLFGLTDDSSDQ
jgi:HEAT repeat protein